MNMLVRCVSVAIYTILLGLAILIVSLMGLVTVF